MQAALASLRRDATTQLSTDILRLREIYAEGRAKCYRQTVVLSSFAAPEMLALMRRSAGCHAGALRLQPHSVHGVLPGSSLDRGKRCLAPPLQPEEADLRFAHFRKASGPRSRKALGQVDSSSTYPRTLIFVRQVDWDAHIIYVCFAILHETNI